MLVHGYRKILLVAFGLLVGWSASAQTIPAAREMPGELSIGGTYQAARANNIANEALWMNGGSGEISLRLPRNLAIDGDGAILHSPEMIAGGPGLRLVTMTCGPRYTISGRSHHVSLFAQGLVGAALGFNRQSVKYPISYGLATLVGGGVNISLSPHVSVRALDANWLRTEVPNATTPVQNFLRLGAGVVYRIR